MNIIEAVEHHRGRRRRNQEYRHIFDRTAAFWQRFFINFTNFECSPRRKDVSYIYDIFHNKCKWPRHATIKIPNLYIEIKHYICHCMNVPINYELGCNNSFILDEMFVCNHKRVYLNLMITNATCYSPHRWPVARKMFPFDDVIMTLCLNPHDVI